MIVHSSLPLSLRGRLIVSVSRVSGARETLGFFLPEGALREKVTKSEIKEAPASAGDGPHRPREANAESVRKDEPGGGTAVAHGVYPGLRRGVVPDRKRTEGVELYPELPGLIYRVSDRLPITG
jgi:hypothetical protein